jgi:hypothetical protein
MIDWADKKSSSADPSKDLPGAKEEGQSKRLGKWDYRLIRREADGEEVTAVHEVYYYQDGGLAGYAAEPVEVEGTSREDVVKRMDRMKQAFLKDVLTPEDF